MEMAEMQFSTQPWLIWGGSSRVYITAYYPTAFWKPWSLAASEITFLGWRGGDVWDFPPPCYERSITPPQTSIICLNELGQRQLQVRGLQKGLFTPVITVQIQTSRGLQFCKQGCWNIWHGKTSPTKLLETPKSPEKSVSLNGVHLGTP